MTPQEQEIRRLIEDATKVFDELCDRRAKALDTLMELRIKLREMERCEKCEKT